MYEKYTNIDQLSDIPTIGSDQDTADLMSALAEADRQPRRTMSTTAVVAGPTSRRRRRGLPKIIVGGRKKRKAIQDDLDALSTLATMDGPVFPSKKMTRRKTKRNLKTSRKGLWLDSRAMLHSLISKKPWAKVPLVKLLKRHEKYLLPLGHHVVFWLTFDPTF